MPQREVVANNLLGPPPPRRQRGSDRAENSQLLGGHCPVGPSRPLKVSLCVRCCTFKPRTEKSHAARVLIACALDRTFPKQLAVIGALGELQQGQ